MDEKTPKDEALLHGKVGMENKAAGVNNDTSDGGNLAQDVREAKVLHYLEPNDVGSELKSMSGEFIVHGEVDELYKGL